MEEQRASVQAVDHHLNNALIANCVTPCGDSCDAEGERQLETKAQRAPRSFPLLPDEDFAAFFESGGPTQSVTRRIISL